MAATILEAALVWALLSSTVFWVLGYSKKIEIGITFCAGVVSVMLSCAILVILNETLDIDFLEWLVIPLTIVLDFVLIGLGVGFSWKLVWKTLAACVAVAAGMAFVMLCCTACGAIF